ncbi:MAG: plasmid mobilization relaxosome protein MobC [Ferruginibacter sp.]
MKERNLNRESRVTIRFSASEFQNLNIALAKTTHRKLATYLRMVILKGPVTIYTRNKSYDEFVSVMVALKGELNAIGNNINQAVKKLHTAHQNEEAKIHALFIQGSQQLLLKKVAEIESKISQIAGQWSQG